MQLSNPGWICSSRGWLPSRSNSASACPKVFSRGTSCKIRPSLVAKCQICGEEAFKVSTSRLSLAVSGLCGKRPCSDVPTLAL